MKTLGERIADLRKERGITQENLAGIIGVSAQAISKWENNATMPDIMLLPIIADTLGVTIDELFGIRRNVQEKPINCEETPMAVYDQILNTMWRSGDNNDFAERAKAQFAKNPYGDCVGEMDMINQAFFEVMLGGDSEGKLFAYPIPTYNIHGEFDWNNPKLDKLWEMAGKFGTPYFANFINSDMDVGDARSMCCRLRLDLKELRRRNGGLFGSGDSTGSIGVVTINLPRLGYENKGDKSAFFAALDRYLDLAKESLEIKRDWLQREVFDGDLIPAFKEYVGTLDNHFSTIGIVGMNEMAVNFMEKDIINEAGKEFCLEVGDHIRSRLSKYQEETTHLYNYEATPAESTCYRLALIDRQTYPDIFTQGSGKDCYYTNSCHIPVGSVESIDKTFAHQEGLQSQFTGGTVIHCYLHGAISGEQAKHVVKAMCEKYKVPYMSLSPISRYCEVHKYIEENVDTCPTCGRPLKKYQRITGYLRCIDNFNRGKRAEFEDRKQL